MLKNLEVSGVEIEFNGFVSKYEGRRWGNAVKNLKESDRDYAGGRKDGQEK